MNLPLLPRSFPPAVRALLLGSLALGAQAAETGGFESLFDGRTLEGWRGQDMSFWTVEDGAITGTISPQHAPRMNQYLVWQREHVQDFELQLEFRFTACAGRTENGGFQFRSRRLPNGDVAGYQVDNNFGGHWKVRLYDEHGRHDLALEGEHTVFDQDGRKETRKLALEAGASDFRLDSWHQYHLTAAGPKLTLAINGKRVAEALDDDPDSFESAGVLALQLHTGPPMKVQFRDIRLKRLPPVRPLSPRERLVADAALHWDLGQRLDSHQPPLKALGPLVIGPSALPEGTSSRPVLRLHRAGLSSDVALNDSRTWNVSSNALTVFIRARATDGDWNAALFAKGVEPAHFHLGGTPSGELTFRICTDAGVASVGFPLARVNAAAWHDLVGRYDGARLRIYCDGRLMAETPAGGVLRPNDEPVLLGGESAAGQTGRLLSGEMAEAALWDRALAPEEMELLSRPDRK